MQSCRKLTKSSVGLCGVENLKLKGVKLLDCNDIADVFWVLLGYNHCALNNKRSKTLIFKISLTLHTNY